jgi:hypothetical protein
MPPEDPAALDVDRARRGLTVAGLEDEAAHVVPGSVLALGLTDPVTDDPHQGPVA